MNQSKDNQPITFDDITTTVKVWHQFLTERVAEREGRIDAAYFNEWLKLRFAEVVND